MASCLRGNFGRTEELTGSFTATTFASFGLAGVGMASLDVKARQDVAVMGTLAGNSEAGR